MNVDEDIVGLELVDPVTFRVTWANEYHRQLPGFADREAVGHRLSDFMPMADELGIDKALRDVAETGRPHHEVMRIVATGSRPAYTWWWSIHRLPSGELLVAYAYEPGEPGA